MAKKRQNYLEGAAILSATVILTKLIGFIYKIPLFNLLGDRGTTHFQLTYYVYSVLLAVSTAGLPVALSRLIASSRAQGRPNQVRRYFRVSLWLFGGVGLAGMAVMLLFPGKLAVWAGDRMIAQGIRALAPAVFFVCVISAFRGYSQGFSDMRPTAVSQIIEVVSKLVFGLLVAWLLLRQHQPDHIVSAGAIVGVTIGLGISVPVLWLMKRRLDREEGDWGHPDTPDSVKSTLRRLVEVSVPITLSSAALSLVTLLDAKLTLHRLHHGAGFSEELAQTLYGPYSKAMNLFNLPSAIIVPVTVSVIPAIAAALARQRGREAREIMESSIKLTNLIALPMAAGLAVLSGPIYHTLFPVGETDVGPKLLMELGIASYFCCVYLITTAILQAAGFEKYSLFALPLGGLVEILVDWILVGRPEINIFGAPMGTLSCYLFITLFNLIFIFVKIKERPNFLAALLRPLLCTLLMAGAAWATNGLLHRALGPGRLKEFVALAAGILAGVAVYVLTVILLGAVTKEDMELIPHGGTIAEKLHLRSSHETR